MLATNDRDNYRPLGLSTTHFEVVVKTMTDRPEIETTAPLVPEMPKARLRTDGGRKREETPGANAVLAEADAPLVPDLS